MIYRGISVFVYSDSFTDIVHARTRVFNVAERNEREISLAADLRYFPYRQAGRRIEILDVYDYALAEFHESGYRYQCRRIDKILKSYCDIRAKSSSNIETEYRQT